MNTNYETKFRFKDKVKIISGFFRGRNGTVVGYFAGSQQYVVKFWFFEMYCTEPQIELIK